MTSKFIKYDWAGTEMIGIESDIPVLNNLTSWSWTEEKAQDIIDGIEDAKSNEIKYEWSTEDIHIVSNGKGVFLFDLMTRRAGEPGNGADLKLDHNEFLDLLKDFQEFIRENIQ